MPSASQLPSDLILNDGTRLSVNQVKQALINIGVAVASFADMVNILPNRRVSINDMIIRDLRKKAIVAYGATLVFAHINAGLGGRILQPLDIEPNFVSDENRQAREGWFEIEKAACERLLLHRTERELDPFDVFRISRLTPNTELHTRALLHCQIVLDPIRTEEIRRIASASRRENSSDSDSSSLGYSSSPSQSNPHPRVPIFNREELEQVQEHMTPSDYRKISAQIAAYDRREKTPSVPYKKRYASANSVNESDISSQCIGSFANIQAPELRTFVNKLKQICTDMNAQCSDVSIIRTELSRLQKKKTLQIHNVPNNKVMVFLVNLMLKNPDDELSRWVLYGRLEDYDVRFKGQSGIGVGVWKTMLQNLLDEVVKYKFFIPCEEGSVRHILNPDINVAYLKQAGFHVKDEVDIYEIYRLIGRLFAYCVCNDIPIPISLSHAILARLIFKDKEIQPEEDVMHFLIDMPIIGRSMINLMKNADNIKDAWMKFNDEFKLVPSKSDRDIDVTNFKSYLQLRAKHQLIHQSRADAFDTVYRLKAMREDFYIRNRLRSAKATIIQLDKLMTGKEINEESIREWLASKCIRPYDDATEANRVYKWFMEILQDFGRNFPLSEVNKEGKIPLAERKQIFIDFIGRLLFFWTSLRKIDTTTVYQVVLIANPYPTSSTCFNQIKLPRAVESKEVLYRKLVSAVYNAEQGVGLMGGRRRKKGLIE